VAAWAVIAAGVVGFGWLLTRPFESSVDPWDNDVSRWFADQRTGSLDGAADVGTFLGETVNGMIVAVVAALAFSPWRRSGLPAVFLGVPMAGMGGFCYARAVRWWVTPLLLVPLLVLLARLYQGAHHLTDVLTSVVYASGWLFVLARVLLNPRDRHA
jgi:undecaprenyl-diphosphatase